ncbi:hypothetical protein [Nocardia flavorosea]|uniref:hypothetical protein n=1 Tax=Nocardia flavorosea TaxID=53429 RepID=UPI001E505D1A|nr:hypothetical protein [Nocardia flavorosea]
MVEGQFHAEAPVYLLLFAWFCCAKCRSEAAVGLDKLFDLLLAQLSLSASCRFECRYLCGDDFSLILYLFDPGRDYGRVGSGFQRGAVLAQLLIEFAEGVACGDQGGCGVGLDLFEHGE